MQRRVLYTKILFILVVGVGLLMPFYPLRENGSAGLWDIADTIISSVAALDLGSITSPEAIANPTTALLSVMGGVMSLAFIAFVFGAAFIFGMPQFSKQIVNHVQAHPFASFGRGAVILLPLLLVGYFLFASLVFMLFSVPFILLGVLLLALGGTFGHIAIANQFLTSDEDGLTRSLVAGSLLTGVSYLVPIVGVFECLLVGCMGLGAMVRAHRAV